MYAAASNLTVFLPSTILLYRQFILWSSNALFLLTAGETGVGSGGSWRAWEAARVASALMSWGLVLSDGQCWCRSESLRGRRPRRTLGTPNIRRSQARSKRSCSLGPHRKRGRGMRASLKHYCANHLLNAWGLWVPEELVLRPPLT